MIFFFFALLQCRRFEKESIISHQSQLYLVRKKMLEKMRGISKEAGGFLLASEGGNSRDYILTKPAPMVSLYPDGKLQTRGRCVLQDRRRKGPMAWTVCMDQALVPSQASRELLRLHHSFKSSLKKVKIPQLNHKDCSLMENTGISLPAVLVPSLLLSKNVLI